MKFRNVSISYAYDVLLSKTIDLVDEIDSQKEGFDLRLAYNEDTARYSCIECNQQLVVVNSARDNIYFRHLPNSSYCILKEAGFNNDLLDAYKKRAFARESPRHKQLKNNIGEALIKDPSVNIGSVDIDSKFIQNGLGDRRRPDVYCEYGDKKIAFEIQLSYLPLHYIINRYEFYKNKGIYLIWIIDYFNSPRELESFQRDIKYIWDHQNLFKYNDSVGKTFKLECHYKQPYLYNNDDVREKWTSSNALLSELTFSEVDYSCFYFNYRGQYSLFVDRLASLKKEILRKKNEEELLKHHQLIEKEIADLINKIGVYRKRDYNFFSLAKALKNFSNQAILELNKIVRLDRKSKDGIPFFLLYVKDYKKLNRDWGMTIVEFILNCHQFKFDINLKDAKGNGVIQYLYENDSLESDLYRLVPLLFLRKYKVQPNDKLYLIDRFGLESEKTFLLMSYYTACDTNEEMEMVRGNLSFFLFIESAIRMELIATGVKSWVAYLVNIMSRYKEYWGFIKDVIVKTELGETLRKADKKGTIYRKVIEFKLQAESSSIEFFSILMKTYPEIFVKK